MVEADSSILLTISLLNARPLLAPRILMGFRCIPRRCGWTYVHFNALEILAAPSASTGSTYRTRTQPYDVLLYAIRRLSYGRDDKYRISVVRCRYFGIGKYWHVVTCICSAAFPVFCPPFYGWLCKKKHFFPAVMLFCDYACTDALLFYGWLC